MRLTFTRQSSEQDWQAGFEHLREFRRYLGHCSVPERYVAEDGFKLGKWVANQRRTYKAGMLTEEHLQALEELGFLRDMPKQESGGSHLPKCMNRASIWRLGA